MGVESDPKRKVIDGELSQDEKDLLRAAEEGMILRTEPQDDELLKILKDDFVQGGTPG